MNDLSKGAVVCVRAKADIWRATTREEVEAWYASDLSKGMTDDGETKLAPQSTYREPDGRTYTVVRARVSARRGYHTIAGCAELEDTDGVRWFAKRQDLAILSGGKPNKDAAPYVLSNNQKKFVKDAERQGLKVDFAYSGRGMFGRQCPSVFVERVGTFATKAHTYSDNLGKGFVVYAPR